MSQQISTKIDHQKFQSEDIQTLLNQNTRLNGIIQQKDKQIQQQKQLISFYQTQKLKENQYFCFILVLLTEIQRLNNKIHQCEVEKETRFLILGQNLKKQHGDKQSSDLPNFELIKELQECLKNFYSFYQKDNNQTMRQYEPLKSPTKSIDTLQSSLQNINSSQNLPVSSENLVQSIILNSQNSIQQNFQPDQYPLYTPIKNQHAKMVTFGKIDETSSLDYSTNSVEKEKQFAFQIESIKNENEKQNPEILQKSQNNNLCFLSHRNKNTLTNSQKLEKSKSQNIHLKKQIDLI